MGTPAAWACPRGVCGGYSLSQRHSLPALLLPGQEVRAPAPRNVLRQVSTLPSQPRGPGAQTPGGGERGGDTSPGHAFPALQRVLTLNSLTYRLFPSLFSSNITSAYLDNEFNCSCRRLFISSFSG